MVEPHDRFERDGLDLVCHATVSFPEADGGGQRRRRGLASARAPAPPHRGEHSGPGELHSDVPSGSYSEDQATYELPSARRRNCSDTQTRRH